jgi:hypothetical protein
VAQIDVRTTPEGEGWTFRVAVSEGNSQTSHRVNMTRNTYQRLTSEACTPEELVRRSFEFLLEREPKEFILREFEITVISRYFPDYEREIRKRIRPCHWPSSWPASSSARATCTPLWASTPIVIICASFRQVVALGLTNLSRVEDRLLSGQAPWARQAGDRSHYRAPERAPGQGIRRVSLSCRSPDSTTLQRGDDVLAAAGEDKGESGASKNGWPPVRPWLRVLPHRPCAVGEPLPTEQVIAERPAIFVQGPG